MALRPSRVIMVLLGVLLLVSVWRMVSVEQEKRHVDDSYAQAQQMIEQLKQERAHLDTELGQARQTIESQASDVGGLKGELEQLQERLDQTTLELSSLQQDHDQLRQQNTSLSSQLSSVMTEKQDLEAKLSSIKELKVAIRDVKRKMWNERLAAWRSHIQAVKAADQEQLAAGNHGYVIRQGAPTLGARSQLEVHVLEPQVQ